MNNKILDYYNNTLTLKGIGELFFPLFKDTYCSLEQKNKEQMLKHISHIYRKWYYSVSKDDTILSPSNIINTQIKKKFGNALILLPHIEYNDFSKEMNKIYQKITIFTLDDHPVIKDLKFFIEECYPDVEITEDYSLNNNTFENLKNIITFNDKSYVDFLLNTCLQLKLLKELPSIHTKRAVPSKNWEDFFKKSQREIISLIVDSIIDIAANNLKDIAPFRPNMFTKEYIKAMLKKPQYMDDILFEIFNDLDIDIYEITSKKIDINKPQNKLEGYVIATIYFLDILLDMYVFTPLGYYMQLIEPTKLNHFDMNEDITQLINLMNNTEDYHHVLYTGFNLFNLTCLGEELFVQGNRPARINAFKSKTDFIDVYYTMMLNSTYANDIDVLNVNNKSLI